MNSPLHKCELFASLPAQWPEDLLSAIRAEVGSSRRKLVVLDDDPTGTQTVHDVPVLTTWEPAVLALEFGNDLPCFYLLTNTRAFPTAEAVRINREIAHNLAKAAGNHEFIVLSRGDSTLRGHFPDETDALGRALTGGGLVTPPVLFVPYFEAGGRYTVNDVHYVAENDTLVPAGDTMFAKDSAFGYRSSNLCAWVEEKSAGAIKAADVKTISLNDIRIGGPEAVIAKLLALRDGDVCIGNAAAPRDLEVLAWAALQAEKLGSRLMYRTAASFVAARLGIAPMAFWQPDRTCTAETHGGLIMVGSHVSKTTQQLELLLAMGTVDPVLLPVKDLMDEKLREKVLCDAIARTSNGIRAGRDVVVFTSRTLISGSGAEESLAISSEVSDALVELLMRIDAAPRFLIAKGGITSSDLATRALGVKRAMVRGQILPGIPVWELGPETKFPGLPYVVFPGNVGGPDSLAEALEKFNSETVIDQ